MHLDSEIYSERFERLFTSKVGRKLIILLCLMFLIYPVYTVLKSGHWTSDDTKHSFIHSDRKIPPPKIPKNNNNLPPPKYLNSKCKISTAILLMSHLVRSDFRYYSQVQQKSHSLHHFSL